MATIATLTFLGCLVLVLLVGAASYMSRGAVRRGGFILACAVGLAGVSGLEIYPAIKLLHDDPEGLSRKAEMDQIRVERDQLLADIHQKERDNEALSRTSAFFNKLHTERMTRIADEIRNAKDIFLGPGSGIMSPATPTETTLTSFVEGPSGFEAIIADLRALKALKARGLDDQGAATLASAIPPRRTGADTTGVIIEPADVRTTRIEGASLAVPPPAPATMEAIPGKTETETLAALHKALDSKMATSSYKVEPVADTDLVAGRTGRYYVIELKSPKSGQNFTFDSGKYTLQASKADYKATFNSFAGEVLKQLEGKAQFELFVRGSADGQAYSGAYEPGFDYRKFGYLPSDGRGKYLANMATAALGNTVRNADLPNLRGEFLRGYLAQLYPTKPATLLEGQVTKKDDPAARNTQLILFVAW